jgi:hypothetical protein
MTFVETAKPQFCDAARENQNQREDGKQRHIYSRNTGILPVLVKQASCLIKTPAG